MKIICQICKICMQICKLICKKNAPKYANKEDAQSNHDHKQEKGHEQDHNDKDVVQMQKEKHCKEVPKDDPKAHEMQEEPSSAPQM